MPPIPRLDFENPLMPPTPGAQRPQAPAQPAPAASGLPVPGGIAPAAATAKPAGSIIAPSGMPQNRPDFGAQGLMNDDMLPPEAAKDPNYMQGYGSNFAVNQPALAYKYGVIRRGTFMPAQQLRGPTPPAAQQGMAAQFQDLLNAQARMAQDKVDQERRERENKDEESARAGAAQLDRSLNSPKALPMLDNFDVDTMRQILNKSDVINNDEQRARIEARLTPMNLTDLIVRGTVRQVVPVQPGVLEFEFQSLPADLRIDLKRMITTEAKKLDVTEDYLLDKHSLMEVTCGIYAINGQVLPDYRDPHGVFSMEAFMRKYEIVARMNTHMISSMAINHMWFEARVRKLFVAEEVKNG